jgi:hypothetical protein
MALGGRGHRSAIAVRERAGRDASAAATLIDRQNMSATEAGEVHTRAARKSRAQMRSGHGQRKDLLLAPAVAATGVQDRGRLASF